MKMAVGVKFKEERKEALERVKEKALLKELEEKDPRLLSIDEEKILARAIKRKSKDSLRARNCFVLCNQGLVVDIAKRYFALLSDKSKTVIGFDDLIQQGNLGLFVAIRKFDPEKGKFGTYAFWWVRQAILREIIYRNWLIRVPSKVADTYHFRFKRIDDPPEGIGNLTPEELAEVFGIDKELIQKTLQASQIYRVGSLNIQVGEDKEDELGSFLANPRSPDPLEETVAAEKGKLLRELLSYLPVLDREILLMRYGIGCPQKELRETAVALYKKGLRNKVLCRERVRQLEVVAIKRLIKKARVKRLISSLDG